MNIVLIGMPGCGKSTVGVVLAKALGMDFVDSDLLIQRSCGKRLHQIIDEEGDEGFRAIENQINAAIDVDNCVVATGGSAVYGEEAMAHLQRIGKLVYLHLPCREIEDRLGDLHARGVSMRPGQTLPQLYEERTPLYRRWAHVTVPCQGLQLREVVARVCDALELR